MMPRADRAHRLTDRELKKLEEKIAKEYIQAHDEIAKKPISILIGLPNLIRKWCKRLKTKK